jgi:hypothetical protein
VTFARGNQLLQRVAADDPQRVAAIVTGRADVVLEFAVDAVATLLTTVGEVAPDRAHLTAETLCRLALATIIAPGELRDPEVMAGYVRSLVTALLVPEPAGKR